MLFSSQPFLLLFLPLALLAYYAVADSYRARLAVLVVSSLAFYAWWDVRFLPLLMVATLVTWGCAQAYVRCGRRNSLIVAGIAFNLSLLGFFKYFNFFAESLLSLAGVGFQPWHIILPLGISFFTFQKISYLMDLRRGSAPAYPLLEYTVFVAFFPQLIAGPIVRHNELIPQFAASPRRAGIAELAARGLVLFVLGLVKKVFFADELAPLANAGFDAAAAGTALGTMEAWLAALAYSLQLYFDFSAYSDMALGLAAMFGLTLPINFDSPYRAASIREFWRRWHMTLSRFLRDYLYIPLGGSRGGLARTCATVMATMVLCGLWHGAGWTFVAWGALHGLAICASRLWARTRIPLPPPLGWALTMLFVVVGWVLFRAESFDAARVVLAAMFGAGAAAIGPLDDDLLKYVALGLLFALAGPTNLEWSRRPALPRRALAVAAGVVLCVVALRVGQGRGLEFIYFQF